MLVVGLIDDLDQGVHLFQTFLDGRRVFQGAGLWIRLFVHNRKVQIVVPDVVEQAVAVVHHRAQDGALGVIAAYLTRRDAVMSRTFERRVQENVGQVQVMLFGAHDQTQKVPVEASPVHDHLGEGAVAVHGLPHRFHPLVQRAAVGQHQPGELDGFQGAGPDDVSSAEFIPPQGARLVTGARSLVHAIKGQLQGHLTKAVRAELVLLHEAFAESGESERGRGDVRDAGLDVLFGRFYDSGRFRIHGEGQKVRLRGFF